jgi:hypothetical protein
MLCSPPPCSIALHHASVVQIAGESYRLKDKHRAGVMARPIRAKTAKEATV